MRWIPRCLAGMLLATSILCSAVIASHDDGIVFHPPAALGQPPPNRLNDPGFEHVGTERSAWQRYGKGFAVDRQVRFEGGQSIRCTSTDHNTELGARVSLVLNHRRRIPIRVTARSRCEDVSGTPSGGYCIWLDVIHTDGSPTWGVVKPFSTGTHDWEQQTLTYLPVKPIRQLYVYCLFRGVTGTVWFDDVSVGVHDDVKVRLFDGEVVELAAPQQPASRPGRITTFVHTNHGLRLCGDPQTGAIHALRSSEGAPVAASVPGGVFIQDAGQRGSVRRLIGPVRVEGATATQPGRVDPLGLDVTATWRAQKDRLCGRITLHARPPVERALSVVVALPVRAEGWWWHDDARRRCRIEAGQTYCNAARLGVGKTGCSSMYPLAAINDERRGLAIAVPLDEPRIVRLTYDAQHGWLYAAFDLTISAEPQKLLNRAEVAVELFDFDPRWGFRAALQRYYELHPEAFHRRVRDVGLWMAFAKISQVERAEDFGFYFKEGLGDQGYDNAHGILTFRYTEPQSHWMPMPKEMARSYAAAVDLLRRRSREGKEAERRRYQATLASSTTNAQGQYALGLHDAPWCNGAAFALNPDPDLPGEATKAKINYDPAAAEKLYADDPQHGIDGEYLDSLDGWHGPNFRREHFRYADVPLVYDTETRQPCLLNALSIWEYVRWLAGHVHGRGKLMMANCTPTRYPWQVALLDVMGQESNWNPGGQWQPMSDAELLYRRSLCGTKPYLLLQNSDFTTWTRDHTRWYLMRAGAYGIQPSFFSANAATDHYFTKPTWYNRDRPVFKQLVPIIRRLGRAGWRPVTYARVDPASLQVERFGQVRSGEVFLTVHNPADQPVTGRLVLGPELRAKRAHELVSRKDLPIEHDGRTGTVTVSLPRRETLFIQLDPTRAACNRD